MSINVYRAAGENQQIKFEEKTEEIKEGLADYYFDQDCKTAGLSRKRYISINFDNNCLIFVVVNSQN